MSALKPGDRIRIIRMEGEPQYEGAIGTVDLIDDEGQAFGTWGGCAVIPGVDSYARIHACALCGRDFEGYPNSGAPLTDGPVCDECNAKLVIPARLTK